MHVVKHRTTCRCDLHRRMAETSLLSAGRCPLRASFSALTRPVRLCRSFALSSNFPRRRRALDHITKPVSASKVVACWPRSSGCRQRCHPIASASLQGTLVDEPRTSGGARELLTWISELPWARVAIWLTVALTASQFQDFFGVGASRMQAAHLHWSLPQLQDTASTTLHTCNK